MRYFTAQSLVSRFWGWTSANATISRDYRSIGRNINGHYIKRLGDKHKREVEQNNHQAAHRFRGTTVHLAIVPAISHHGAVRLAGLRRHFVEMPVKRALLAFCLSLLTFEAQAISRYDTMNMNCGQVQSAIDREGAAVLRYRSLRDPSVLRFDRFVRDRQYCKHNERAETTMVPTADRRACAVRECRVVEPERFPRLLRRP